MYTNSEQVRKVHKILPKAWKAKVTTIQKAKDLNTLPLEELLGSLISYEMSQWQTFQEEAEKEKRLLAFKSTTSKDEELSLIIRKFKRLMKKKWNREKKQKSWTCQI